MTLLQDPPSRTGRVPSGDVAGPAGPIGPGGPGGRGVRPAVLRFTDSLDRALESLVEVPTWSMSDDQLGEALVALTRERARLQEARAAMPGVKAWPSDANMILVRVPGRLGGEQDDPPTPCEALESAEKPDAKQIEAYKTALAQLDENMARTEETLKDNEQRGEQPARPAGVEAPQGDAVVLLVLGEQQAGACCSPVEPVDVSGHPLTAPAVRPRTK